MKELIDSTSNLQISSDNNKPQHKVGPQQSQQSRNSHFEEMFPQAKRFPYNPYKIMGFQNRESNEFAMNVLKTQMNEQRTSNNINNSGNDATYEPINRNNKLMDGNFTIFFFFLRRQK